MSSWINLQAYTPSQLLWNGAGCVFWLLAYALLVVRIVRNRFVEMPAFVAGANLGWEMVWSVWFHPRSGLLFSWMYAGAAVLDIFIFASVLRYGHLQLTSGRTRIRQFRVLCTLNTIAWLVLCYFARADGLDDPLGAYSGYVINVILSYTSVSLLYRMPDRSKFSALLGLFRFLGTGLISISMVQIYPTSRWLHLLCLACAVLDGWFVLTLVADKLAVKHPALAREV
jgi:hypothetical protein